MNSEFSNRVLDWYAIHGRSDLPWQVERSLYRVWVSEVMLQQTQVSTVIPYFQRFIARFPSIQSLAGTPLDEVLHHWSGLGYYARARNMHRAAQIIRDQYSGQFPEDFDAVLELPGIGRSTAGAILALATGQRHVILDGNVKRVLARFHAIEGWTGQARVEARLWELAAQHTPSTRVADYTQAIMDLGATLCTPKKPRCSDCPVQMDCTAHTQSAVQSYPQPRPRRALPRRRCRMLLLVNSDHEVLLERRPPTGIWGGLWSLPECPWDEPWTQWCQDALHLRPKFAKKLDIMRHTFSHFHLDIHPVFAHVDPSSRFVMEPDRWVWYNTASSDLRGLSAPIKRLIEQLPSPTAGV